MLSRLFMNFLKVGAVSFGGGYAVVSMIQQEVVEKYQIITPAQFIDLVAISQISPGPLAINASTFVGYMTDGILGATVTTLAVILVPSLLAYGLSTYYETHGESQIIKRAMLGIRPCVAPLIFVAVIDLLPMSMVDVKSYIIAGIVLVLYIVKKISPIKLIGIGALLGYLFYGLM